MSIAAQRAPVQVVASPGRLLAACLAGAAVALLGLGLAGAAAGLASSAADGGQEWLDGLVEGLFAGAVVVLCTLPAMAWAVRRVAGNAGRVTPGWGWSAGAVAAGVLAPSLFLWAATTLTEGSSYATQNDAVALASTVSPLLALGAAWLVLLGWRRGA